jgi:hypothetical protein
MAVMECTQPHIQYAQEVKLQEHKLIIHLPILPMPRTVELYPTAHRPAGHDPNFFSIGIMRGGVQSGPLRTAAIHRPIMPAPGDYDDGEIG